MNPKLHTALKKCSKSGMGTLFVTGASLYCFIQPPKATELGLGEPHYDVIKLEQHQHFWPGMDSNQWIGSLNRCTNCPSPCKPTAHPSPRISAAVMLWFPSI